MEIKAQTMPPAPRTPKILVEKGDLKIHPAQSVLQPGAEVVEGGVLGQDRILVKPEAAGAG